MSFESSFDFLGTNEARRRNIQGQRDVASRRVAESRARSAGIKKRDALRIEESARLKDERLEKEAADKKSAAARVTGPGARSRNTRNALIATSQQGVLKPANVGRRQLTAF